MTTAPVFSFTNSARDFKIKNKIRKELNVFAETIQLKWNNIFK